jgi:hypothetical protein
MTSDLEGAVKLHNTKRRCKLEFLPTNLCAIICDYNGAKTLLTAIVEGKVVNENLRFDISLRKGHLGFNKTRELLLTVNWRGPENDVSQYFASISLGDST